MSENKNYDFEVKSITESDNSSFIKITEVIPPGRKYTGSMNSYLIKKDERIILEQKGIVPGFKFISQIEYFNDALEDLLFGREVDNIESEVVNALINGDNGIDARGIDYQKIINWIRNEDRIYINKNDKWNLIISEWCQHINSIFVAAGHNDIKIHQLDPRDHRINRRIKGQAGYFELIHPKGHFYCSISGAKSVYSILGELD